MLLSSGSGPSELCESRALHGDKRGILRKSDYREVKPQSKAELISGISKFWETASAEKCQRYISHLKSISTHLAVNTTYVYAIKNLHLS